MKHGYTKKFESAKKPLKKDYAYSYKYTNNVQVKKVGDSINYMLQIKGVTFTEAETEKDLKTIGNAQIRYNYPIHYDIEEIDKSEWYDFTPRGITIKTQKDHDQ